MENEDMTALALEQEYESLPFTNNFIFCKVMENNLGLCRKLLEVILGVKLRGVKLVEQEKQINILPGHKSVRLDVYVDDEEGTVYNIEMQTSKNRNLPKRTRYYQGMIDLNLIAGGMDYSALRRSYVIFICTFDYFGEGEPVYTFTNRCMELPWLELGDDTVKVFVNPYGEKEGMTDDMRSFMKYLRDNRTDGNPFVRSIDEQVREARNCQKWRMEYMTWELEMRDRLREAREEAREQGIEQGIERGIEQGIEAMIIDNLEDGKTEAVIIGKIVRRFGLTPEKAKEKYDEYAGQPV